MTTKASETPNIVEDNMTTKASETPEGGSPASLLASGTVTMGALAFSTALFLKRRKELSVFTLKGTQIKCDTSLYRP